MVDLGRTLLEMVVVTSVAPEFPAKIVFVVVLLTWECQFFFTVFGANSGSIRVTSATSPKVPTVAYELCSH